MRCIKGSAHVCVYARARGVEGTILARRVLRRDVKPRFQIANGEDFSLAHAKLRASTSAKSS